LAKFGLACQDQQKRIGDKRHEAWLSCLLIYFELIEIADMTRYAWFVSPDHFADRSSTGDLQNLLTPNRISVRSQLTILRRNQKLLLYIIPEPSPNKN